VQKVGRSDAKWDRQGRFFRKARQEDALPYPCRSLGKGQPVTWCCAAPDTFANEPASQLLILDGCKDLRSASQLRSSGCRGSSCQGHSALSWRLHSQPHGGTLGTNTLLPSLQKSFLPKRQVSGTEQLCQRCPA